jgi:NAD(P)H-dependent nitrite reductase small subunit
MAWLDVCGVDDLQADSGVCALVAGKQIALFYLPKEQGIYAIDNYDPFSHANVLSRGIIGDIAGQPVVASPLYKQHFNLITGVCLEEPSVQISSYPLRIENNRIHISLTDDNE